MPLVIFVTLTLSFVKATLLTNAFMCKWTLWSDCEGGMCLLSVWIGARWEAGVENRGNPENVDPWESAKIPGRTSFSKAL